MRRHASNQLLQSLTARAAIAILLLTPVPAAAQDVTEPALKAAFIYNFAKFTEWPADVMPAASAVRPVCARRRRRRRSARASGQGPHAGRPQHRRVAGGARRAAARRVPHPVRLRRDRRVKRRSSSPDCVTRPC